MNKYFVLGAIFCSSILTSVGAGANFANIQTFASSEFVSDFYDKECADRMFDKYMKDAEPEYDKYLDKADDVPLPDSESEVDDYLDSLDPLAEEYIDNLDPYAEDYIDNLGVCMS
jgi:hypothetical protein